MKRKLGVTHVKSMPLLGFIKMKRSKHMQIIITGPRGGGSTTLAAELLYHLVNELGQEVHLVCGSDSEKRCIIDEASQPKRDLCYRAKISIIVGHEREDEVCVRLRKPNVTCDLRGNQTFDTKILRFPA